MAFPPSGRAVEKALCTLNRLDGRRRDLNRVCDGVCKKGFFQKRCTFLSFTAHRTGNFILPPPRTGILGGLSAAHPQSASVPSWLACGWSRAFQVELGETWCLLGVADGEEGRRSRWYLAKLAWGGEEGFGQE